MNNSEVCHLWANQSRPAASGSNLFFDGPTLYSYGRHFPVASIVPHPVTGRAIALFNRERYSNSTGKHQSYARSAASHLECYFVCQCDVTKTPRNAAQLAKMVRNAEEADKTEGEAKRRLANEKAKRRREERKRTAEAMQAFPSDLTAWRAGGRDPRAGFITGTALRICPSDPGMIETSRGAIVPASVARKAWPILAAAVARECANPSEQAWTPFFERPEWNWGDYKGIALRRIALGSPVTLQVGCHEIPWSEIETMAASLGLIKQAVSA